ncbi:MAG: 5-(carboxyamino)imidazole ribonucleotide mutase [Desulfobacteraceae bacterium]|nr:MAG: 5-(carboxyamino)imidazole ribonucleotide mutase [Desulfobacteraceae bacterium]
MQTYPERLKHQHPEEVSLKTGKKASKGLNRPPEVGIVMGSDSDLEIMEETASVLKKFGVSYEMTVASAHRSPKRAAEFASSAHKRGIKVIVAGAGHAAHLAGTMAAFTWLPVIGVPIDSSCLQGFDSLLSTVQMPPGVPVATVSIGKPGARNAGILAVQILAISDKKLTKMLEAFKEELAKQVDQKANKLKDSSS